MKKLSKIKLQDAVVLENQEMKMISGGLIGPSGFNGQWCYVNGEGVGPFTSCSDAFCQRLYGPEAYCS